MKIIRFFLLCSATLIFSKKGSCQDDSLYQFLQKIDYPVISFAVSSTGELFTVNLDNQLKKYNFNGDSVGVFNDVKKYGKLSYVVAQNPWKTILYYENFETIVLLDKYLKVLGSINLRDKNIYGVKAVTTSYDNNIWVFDGREFKIKKISENGIVLSSSVDLRQVFDDAPNPVKIIDQDGLLYLYDPNEGVYIFDYYGSFKKLLPFKDWKNVFVVGKTIYGFDGVYIYTYKSPMPIAEKIILPAIFREAEQIDILPRRIYILKKNALLIYKSL